MLSIRLGRSAAKCFPSCVVATLVLLTTSTWAAEPDPCTRFTWDVSHELAVMQQAPQAIAGGTRPGAGVPSIQTDKLYEVKLADQSAVTFRAKPAKPALDEGSQAGLLRFRTQQAGRYRVAITSGHWIDVVDDTQPVKSRDFQGQRGCERPHKIVEYQLPAGRELILQLSGSTQAAVLLSVTTVVTQPAPSAQ